MVALRTRPIAHQTATVRRRWNAASAGALPVPASCGEPHVPRLARRVVPGRYRLRRLLRRGGMGTLWLANDRRLRRPVAVKQLVLTSVAADEERLEARARLRYQARLTARVDHPGTVQIYDLVEEGGQPWIVMEALGGRTLEATLRDHGPNQRAQATRLGLVIEGLLAKDPAQRLDTGQARVLCEPSRAAGRPGHPGWDRMRETALGRPRSRGDRGMTALIEGCSGSCGSVGCSRRIPCHRPHPPLQLCRIAGGQRQSGR